MKTILYCWVRIMTAPIISCARWCVRHGETTPAQKIEVLDKIEEVEQQIERIKQDE